MATITTTTSSSAASDLLAGANAVSETVYSLPMNDFIVTHGLTSNGGSRVILESIDGVHGVLSLYNNPEPELLKELLPEDVYTAGTVELYFKPSASAGSNTIYNFQLYPNQAVAKKLLAMKGEVAQPMVFPTKKAQLTGDEASLATSINRGNKGRAAIDSTKAFKGKDNAISSFFKGLLG